MNKSIDMICPICGDTLNIYDRNLSCLSNHTYDIAKQGYVNLLPVQNKHSLNPGDTKEMLLARRSFLNTDTYLPISQEVIKTAKILLQSTPCGKIADIGCGEGYYLEALKHSIDNCDCIGVDISKEGVRMACSRDKDISWVVSTATCLPIETNTIDLITAMFSLVAENEFARILKTGGHIIEVTAGSNHLIELKQIIYDNVFHQSKKPAPIGDAFTEISCDNHTFNFTLNNTDLVNLLKMTPHYWRIKKEHREELEKTPQLTLTADYWIRVLRRK